MRKIFKNSKGSMLWGFAVFLLVASVTVVSCEKEVDIKLDTGEQRLVIEGGIENNLPPFVRLTKSVGYFEKIDLTTLQNSSVHDAEVYVSDGTKTVRLKEYSIDTGNNGAKFYYYGLVDLANPMLPPFDSLILGELEKFYSLRVVHDGKTYEAITKIPTPTPIDSILSIEPARPEAPTGSRILDVYFRDPDTLGNYLRYYTQKNSEPFYPALNSVFNDEIINGKNFNSEFPLGEPRTQEISFDSLGLCFPGDTVVLKWTAIDKGVYDFWNTLEYAMGTLGSPFATPIQVTSNISNDALGVWAGYGAIYDTVYIK